MRSFKILSFFFLLAISSFSCKKAIDKVKEDLMLNLITNNSWFISKYAEGTSNKTSEYANFEVKFYKDYTVDIIVNGVKEVKGTWQGNEVTYSVTAAFPPASTLINRLNGEWLITNTKSKPWRVYSHRFEGSTEFFLDLEEKQ